MKIKKYETLKGSIEWRLPNPIWSNLVLRTSALTHVYTLRNTGPVPVTISAVQLIPGGDPRLRITGGTCCNVGSIIPSGGTGTIHLTANPKVLGDVHQALRVQHTGIGSSLRIDIFFTVTDLPTRERTGTYLVEETSTMDRQRRLAEQDGHRRLARVHAREHYESQSSASPEGELQNNILQNPWLDSQRFDGIDPNLNPEPPLNTDARREFDNERREQEMEKQLRLGNMPKFNTAPKPQGP